MNKVWYTFGLIVHRCIIKVISNKIMNYHMNKLIR